MLPSFNYIPFVLTLFHLSNLLIYLSICLPTTSTSTRRFTKEFIDYIKYLLTVDHTKRPDIDETIDICNKLLNSEEVRLDIV